MEQKKIHLQSKAQGHIKTSRLILLNLSLKPYFLKSKRIVITGGPGTGKSSIMQQLEAEGACCFHEISRQVTLDARKNGVEQLFLTDPIYFSQKLLEGRIRQFKEAENGTKPLVYFDRGIPDVKAYLDFSKTPCPPIFIEAGRQYRYDLVFMLPLWEEIYVCDNERYESYSQAGEIHHALVTHYIELGYNLIEIPPGSVANRAYFIINYLKPF